MIHTIAPNKYRLYSKDTCCGGISVGIKDMKTSAHKVKKIYVIPAHDCMDVGGRVMQEQLPRRDPVKKGDWIVNTKV